MDDLAGCAELREIRMEAQIRMEAGSGRSSQPAPTLHISEPAAPSEPAVSKETPPTDVPIAHPDVASSKSPSPTPEEVENAMKTAQDAADHAAADSFLNLSSPSESTPVKTAPAPCVQEIPADTTTAEDTATAGAQSPLVFEQIQVDPIQPEVVVEEVVREEPHTEVPQDEDHPEDVREETISSPGPTPPLGPQTDPQNADAEEVDSPLHSDEDDEPGVDAILKAKIKAWKKAPSSTFAFTPSGHDRNDMATMRAIIEAQAALISQQEHEITGLKLHSVRQAQTLEYWKNKFKLSLEEHAVRLRILENSFYKYIKEKKQDTSNYPFLKQKVELYHSIQESNFTLAQEYYKSITAKLNALPTDPIAVADTVAKALAPIQERITTLEIQADKIPDLQAQIRDLLSQVGDDAKKGEGYSETAEQFVEEHMKAFRSAAIPPPRLDIPQVSEELQSQRHGKRPREDKGSPQAKKRLYTGEEKTPAHPDHILRVSQKLLPQQELKRFGDKGLLVSHGNQFHHYDKWVPSNLNDWYEAQREVFIKWYYVFAKINRRQISETDAWKFFLYFHPDKSKVKRLYEAAVEKGVKEIAYPSYKTVAPPKTGSLISLAQIELELNALAAIHRLPLDPTDEGYLDLKKSLYKMYGQSSNV